MREDVDAVDELAGHISTTTASGAVDVSVIMPMRNPGRFLPEAVESILRQDYQALELVVVDDGSNDGSREYIEKHSDSRIKLIDGPRAGISACMNTGLRAAVGAVIMRCDADDLYPAGRIGLQVQWLRDHPAFVAVCGAFSMIAPDGAPVASPFRHAAGEQLDAARRIIEGRLKTHLCTFALRRQALDREALFREYFETAEDIDFTLRLAEVGPIGFVSRNEYEYRLHGDSITHTQASARRLFFEATAYAMSRERQQVGTDALMRGVPPEPPAEGGRPDAGSDAGLHMAQLLVGESWDAFGRGDKGAAVTAAWRAVKIRPGHVPAWKALLLVSTRRLPRS